MIAHSPAEGAFVFLPDLPPKFVSYQFASLWIRRFPSTPVMLFTKEDDQKIGHFQFCQEHCPATPDLLHLLLAAENCSPRPESLLDVVGCVPMSCSCQGLATMNGCSFNFGRHGRNAVCIDLDPDSALPCQALPPLSLPAPSALPPLKLQVQQVQSQSPIDVPLDVAQQATRRFPDDLPRSIAEACRIVYSPRSRPSLAAESSSSHASPHRPRSPCRVLAL